MPSRKKLTACKPGPELEPVVIDTKTPLGIRLFRKIYEERPDARDVSITAPGITPFLFLHILTRYSMLQQLSLQIDDFPSFDKSGCTSKSKIQKFNMCLAKPMPYETLMEVIGVFSDLRKFTLKTRDFYLESVTRQHKTHVVLVVAGRLSLDLLLFLLTGLQATSVKVQAADLDITTPAPLCGEKTMARLKRLRIKLTTGVWPDNVHVAVKAAFPGLEELNVRYSLPKLPNV